jgi:hypothetical protein
VPFTRARARALAVAWCLPMVRWCRCPAALQVLIPAAARCGTPRPQHSSIPAFQHSIIRGSGGLRVGLARPLNA